MLKKEKQKKQGVKPCFFMPKYGIV